MAGKSFWGVVFVSIALGLTIASGRSAAHHSKTRCDQDYYDREIQFDHDHPDGCQGRQNRKRRHGRSAKRCYLQKAIVDPGFRHHKDNIFPRIQDAIDAIRPGGTVIVRSRTGAGAGTRGGLPGDRDYIFLESLVITKPMTLSSADGGHGRRVKAGSGPDGRCLTIDLRPNDRPCRFPPKYRKIFVRYMDWAESDRRASSATSCIDVQNGVLRLDESDITWRGDRAAISVGRRSSAYLKNVDVSVAEGTGAAVASHGAILEITRGTFRSTDSGVAISISGGKWKISGADIHDTQTGVGISLTHTMRGKIVNSKFTANQSGLTATGTRGGSGIGARLQVYRNVFDANGIGARFDKANSVSFENNSVSGSGETGLVISGTSGDFSNNILENNYVGIEIGVGPPRQRHGGGTSHPRLFNNRITGKMEYAIGVLPGGAAVMRGNLIRAPKCRCLWGDIDSRDLFFRRTDCPKREWSGYCRRDRERRQRELEQESGQEGASSQGQ